MKYLVSEFFDLVEKQPTKEAKINLLRQHNNEIVRSILALNYNHNYKFYLPEGEPPFKKDTDKPMGYQETTLQLELRRFYVWTKLDANISNLKKESLFIQMLEGLHYTEAELICLVKDRKIDTKYKSLTEDFVREAIPDLLPPPLPKPEPEKKTRVKKSSTSTVAA